MRIGTIVNGKRETAALVLEGSAVPMDLVSRAAKQWFPDDVLALLSGPGFEALRNWYDRLRDAQRIGLASEGVPVAETRFAPLYRHPRKIWGIGLNYRDHAADLDEKPPTDEPASFMKPDTAIIGPGDTIELPRLSNRVTGEAELGLVFGTTCRDVARKDWKRVLAGFTTIIDMTAEDILRRNPRNLTQCKSFDTFFSFGPLLVTPDEFDDPFTLRVRTVHNGRIHAQNTVSRMTFPPDHLVWYHTQIMTMLPGDIISTGTPGAAPLADGDTIACEIDGFPTLANPVHDLKLAALETA